MTVAGRIDSLRALQAACARMPEGRAEFRARVAIAANFSTQFLAPALRLMLLERSVSADIYEAPYDQWERLLLDPQSELAQFRPDVTVLVLTRRDAPADLERRAREAAGRSVLVWVEEGEGATLGPVWEQPSDRPWFAARYWETARLPFHPDLTARAARFLAGVVRNQIAPAVKAVVTDLDNVLWGGVVGEVGAEGVEPRLDLQRFLLDLRSRGVLLAISSANNPEDAAEAFERRDDMILRRAHFAAFEADWEPKPDHLRRIAGGLNLGLQNVCFLDDSPFERNRVRAMLPEVIVPELPEDPARVVAYLRSLGDFEIPVRTREDAMRARMMQQERRREEARGGSAEDYYRRLNLTAKARRVSGGMIERVVQLIHKTNQFNLTARRHPRAAVEAWSADPSVYCSGFEVKDRYGDYGLVGVLFALPDGDAYRIDTWLLSCRAMGRTVEHAMIAHLVGWLQGRGGARLRGEFVQSPKNAPVRDLYASFGFEADGPGRFVLNLDSFPRDANRFVRLLEGDA